VGIDYRGRDSSPEFRIAICPGTGKPLSIRLGPVHDIAM
jgi:hypothetical protein